MTSCANINYNCFFIQSRLCICGDLAVLSHGINVLFIRRGQISLRSFQTDDIKIVPFSSGICTRACVHIQPIAKLPVGKARNIISPDGGISSHALHYVIKLAGARYFLLIILRVISYTCYLSRLLVSPRDSNARAFHRVTVNRVDSEKRTFFPRSRLFVRKKFREIIFR